MLRRTGSSEPVHQCPAQPVRRKGLCDNAVEAEAVEAVHGGEQAGGGLMEIALCGKHFNGGELACVGRLFQTKQSHSMG